MSAPLDPDRLEQTLAGSKLARTIKVFAETASTNDVAAQYGHAGAAEGVAIFAERQTRGRGRQGRAWESEPGAGLAFSLLLRPELPLADWTRLTLCTALAVAEACEEAGGVPALIKWPNDIYLHGRKAAGILIETIARGAAAFAVVGIGINVNQTHFPAELAETATSLRLAGHREIAREPLAAAAILKLEALYAKMGIAFDDVLATARARDFLFGRAVRCQGANTVLQGVAEGFAANGGLRLRHSNGALEVICGGEISVRAC